jgi:hypothetical protein
MIEIDDIHLGMIEIGIEIGIGDGRFLISVLLTNVYAIEVVEFTSQSSATSFPS